MGNQYSTMKLLGNFDYTRKLLGNYDSTNYQETKILLGNYYETKILGNYDSTGILLGNYKETRILLGANRKVGLWVIPVKCGNQMDANFNLYICNNRTVHVELVNQDHVLNQTRGALKYSQDQSDQMLKSKSSPMFSKVAQKVATVV